MKILVLGSNGLVGNSIRNHSADFNNYEMYFSNRKDTDLFSYNKTYELISNTKPDVIINAAAKVGGIHANNTNKSEFLLENLKINMNILETIKDFRNIYLINLGSSCIYPLDAANPIKEGSIMTGKLEPTNSPYAMAKLTAIELGNAISSQYGNKIINLMPTNLYGPNDNFSSETSHVIPGLIRRMHKAKLDKEEGFKIWGTGKPMREFLHVGDLAEAIFFIIGKQPDETLLNIGSGVEISILDLAKLIKEVIGFEGELLFDNSMPDGNPRKFLDSTNIYKLGWEPKIELKDGLTKTYSWFLKNSL
jgi:GDP-L-fucose synthase